MKLLTSKIAIVKVKIVVYSLSSLFVPYDWFIYLDGFYIKKKLLASKLSYSLQNQITSIWSYLHQNQVTPIWSYLYQNQFSLQNQVTSTWSYLYQNQVTSIWSYLHENQVLTSKSSYINMKLLTPKSSSHFKFKLHQHEVTCIKIKLHQYEVTYIKIATVKVKTAKCVPRNEARAIASVSQSVCV